MHPGSPHRENERGIALVAALLTLMLAFTLTGTFMATTVGERSLSSNVHIARSALFSADAGVRVMQQVLANTARAKLDSLIDYWSGNGPVIPHPENLFPAGDIVTSASTPRFSAAAQIVFTDSTVQDTAQVYNYSYTITATGGFGGFGSRRVQSHGVLRVSASHGTFTDFLLFTEFHNNSSGAPVWFSSNSTFDGRVHTNGELRFAYRPSFYDQVSSVNPKAIYYNKGHPKELASDHNANIDVPNFYGGFVLGATPIALPSNAYVQQNAALGLPATGDPPSNSTINTRLGLAGSSPPPNDIYLVHAGTVVDGGIYVQGDLTRCVMQLDSLGRQVYVMTQGSTQKTFTIDVDANSTTVKEGASTITYTGVPAGVTYINGELDDLRGPSRISMLPRPALANGTQLQIVATGDIVLQGDLAYEDYATGESVLGLFSSSGDVLVGTAAPNDMYLDSYVMATGTSGEFEVINWNSGSPRGAFHLRGGVITRYFGSFYTFDSKGVLQTGYARDFHYDRRGLIPPFFPTTSTYAADQPVARTLVWKEL